MSMAFLLKPAKSMMLLYPDRDTTTLLDMSTSFKSCEVRYETISTLSETKWWVLVKVFP